MVVRVKVCSYVRMCMYVCDIYICLRMHACK